MSRSEASQIYQLHQSDFHSLIDSNVESKPLPEFSRSLITVFEKDLPATVIRIREIYFPDQPCSMFEDIPEIIPAATTNPTMFSIFRFYPYYHTVSYISCLEKVEGKGSRRKVSFAPSTDEWDKDLRRNTLPTFDHLKAYPHGWELNIDINNPGVLPTTFLRIMTEYWRSGHQKRKVLAEDIITCELFKTHWLTLIRRAGRK